MSDAGTDDDEVEAFEGADLSGARVAYLVKQLELALRARLDVTTRAHGLTTAQYTALSALRNAPGLSSAQLARRTFVSAQTTQEMIATLKRRGLVRRTRDPSNRRVLRLSLTDEGIELLEASDRAVDDIEEVMTAHLDPAQLGYLREALRSCVGQLAGKR